MAELVTGPSASFVAQQQQQPDLLGQYSHLLQLKGLQQQQALAPLQLQAAQQNVQAGQLSLQQQQREADSQKAIMDAWSNSNGDIGKTYSEAAKTGKVLPADLVKLQQSGFALKEQAMKMLQAQGERAVQEGDLYDGAVDAVHAAPPEQRAAVYQQQVANLQKSGVDVSQVPQQYPGDDAFNVMRLGIKSHKSALDQAAKQAETQKNQAQTLEAQAGTAQKQAETSFYAQNGGAPGVSAEIQQQADWLKKNPGKGPSDYKLWVMKNSPTAMVMNNQLGGAKNDDALNFAAENYRQTGQLPAGFTRSPQTTSAIISRAAELDKQSGGQGVAVNKTILNANKTSLDSLQKNFDQVNAFENTALKNMDLLQQTAQKIPDLGTKFANVPIRMISGNMIGTANMAAFKTALNTAQTEAAKVLNSSNASGVLSDSARHELQQLVDGNATYPALKASLDTLRQDMANRHQSYQMQIQDIQNRIKGGGQSQSAPSGPAVGTVENGYRFKGGDPSKQSSWEKQ